MLEFYRKEKKEKFARLEELYATAKKNIESSKSQLRFDAFSAIVAGEYDKSISDQEVCNLYREAYVGGGCAVNLDSILLTFSDT